MTTHHNYAISPVISLGAPGVDALRANKATLDDVPNDKKSTEAKDTENKEPEYVYSLVNFIQPELKHNPVTALWLLNNFFFCYWDIIS